METTIKNFDLLIFKSNLAPNNGKETCHHQDEDHVPVKPV